MGKLTTNFSLPDGNSFSAQIPNEIIAVRVKDIILDDSHPEYDKYGFVDSIGAIKYSLINSKIDTRDTTTLAPAFPISPFSNTFPLVNEVVFIIKGVKGDTKFETVDYYLPPLSLFNDINYIPSEDQYDESKDEPGYEFKTNPEIRPFYPFHGDTILQGRHGQGIRFTGSKSFKNTLVNDSNAGRPLTILTNGIEKTAVNSLYVEDVNKDNSSIYLTSDHIIPLNQIRDKYSSADNRPVLAKNYKGAQVLINSGRLFFNAYDDDLLISAQNNFGVTSKQVSLDGVDSVGLDAKKIYLGEKARRFELQPVLLGNQTELLLFTLINSLKSLATNLQTAKTVDQKPIPKLNINGFSLEATLNGLLNQINPNGESLLKSKKVFVE